MDEQQATLINLLRHYDLVDVMQMLVAAHSAPTPSAASEAPVAAPEAAPVTAAEVPVTAAEVPVTAAEAPVTAAEAPVTAAEAPVTASVSNDSTVQGSGLMWSPTMPTAPNVQPVDFALRPGGAVERTLASYGYDIDGNLLSK